MGILTPETLQIAHRRSDHPEPNHRSTQLGEKGGDESSAVPHGSVGEGDSPNEGSKSGDSDSRSVGTSLAFGSGCLTTGAAVATAGVLVSKPVTELVAVPGGSTP